MEILARIKSPADVKQLTPEELLQLKEELRQEIISAVSKTGGHLASNLGAVELTVALHAVFDFPTDKLIWDVSHQTYGHKILTGRRDRMDTIRQYGGLAGFSKREESIYDDYGAGHASTSISTALGFAAARDNAGKNHKVIAVIGDGSMTGGLAFEGLNNAGHLKKDLLVVLNDNTWSISKNVGAISKYLTSIMADEKFNKLRSEIWELTGFRYFGPIDGHDLPLLIDTLKHLKNLPGPLMLHIATVKGKGYNPAEEDAFTYHGVGKFDKVTGKLASGSPGLPAYTNVFGDVMCEIAALNDKVIAITAAMTSGTGLVKYSEEFPERFFDVGIAEGHAGCFAGGLAAEGMKPYLVVYSTFLQRAYDQVIHDIALQKLPVVICMDRAGLVGNDGPTHHGAFDLSYLAAVPNMTVCAPKDGNELRSMLYYTANNPLTGPVAIRYPRGNVPTAMQDEIKPMEWGKWEAEPQSADIAILAVGTMVDAAYTVAEKLRENDISVKVVNARFIKPFDVECLNNIMKSTRFIFTMEENSICGGFGQMINFYLSEHDFNGKCHSFAIPDRFVTHGNRDQLMKEIGLDTDSLYSAIIDYLHKHEPADGFIKKLLFRKSNEIKKNNKHISNQVETTEGKKTG